MKGIVFSDEVQRIVGPTLVERGFALDQVDEGADEGGRELSIVYYRGPDCRLQIYRSAREGETNCMIAPLTAPNEYGLRSASRRWRHLAKYVERPDLPFNDLLRLAREEHDAYESSLHWVAAFIEKHLSAAQLAIESEISSSDE